MKKIVYVNCLLVVNHTLKIKTKQKKTEHEDSNQLACCGRHSSELEGWKMFHCVESLLDSNSQVLNSFFFWFVFFEIGTD
jgi:hypothetical protein